jgi:hypothetical protein
MKKFLLPLCLIVGISSYYKAQVGIGTNTPNTSSLLDINVNNLPANGKKGLLIPQVTLSSNTDVLTIPNPANGLLVYNIADAGTSPSNVSRDTLYKYNSLNNKWELLMDETSFASLKIPVIGSILGFNATGNNTTYLGSDLGANIRQVMFDNILLQNSACTYDNTTKEFIANKTGFYNFQINLVFRGAYSGSPRLGVSRPYTGAKPTAASNATFAFLSQNSFTVDATTPVAMSVSGLLFMNAGEKVIFLTRYIDPTVNTLNVEAINYNRTLVNSVNVTYFSN